MKKRFISLFLISLSLFVFIWTSLFVVISLKKYFYLNKRTMATVFSWNIVQKKEKFIICADYFYKVGNKKFGGKTYFKNRYLNYFSAFDTLNKLSKKDWYAFYASKNNESSNLEKIFPLKNIIYAAISFFIFVYFIFFQKKLLIF